MQLLIPFRRLSAVISRNPSKDRSTPNLAVRWSPYMPPPKGGAVAAASVGTAPALPRLKLKRSLVWIVALELGLAATFLVGVSYFRPADASRPAFPSQLALIESLHGYVCGRDGRPDTRQTAAISKPQMTLE
jgi:hypothetical protein